MLIIVACIHKISVCRDARIYNCLVADFFLSLRHFDKNKSQFLDHQEFKSCLRSLGYDLPMVDEGQPEPEFEAILQTVDPNKYAP